MRQVSAGSACGSREGHRSRGDPQLAQPGTATPALPELWQGRGAGAELRVPFPFLALECGCACASRQTCCSLCLCCARVAVTELPVPTSAQCAGRRCLSSPWVHWGGGRPAGAACAGWLCLAATAPRQGWDWGCLHPSWDLWGKLGMVAPACSGSLGKGSLWTHPSASSARGHDSSLCPFPSVFQMSLPHRNTVLPAAQVGAHEQLRCSSRDCCKLS